VPKFHKYLPFMLGRREMSACCGAIVRNECKDHFSRKNVDQAT
jgi:hypothetical protein